MGDNEFNKLLDKLRGQEEENEWIEFKVNNTSPAAIGERVSALSNGACLRSQPFGYLIYGVENGTKKIVGTTEYISRKKKGNEDIEHWIIQSLSPKLDIEIFNFNRGELKISIIKIPAAVNQPTRFRNIAYVRIGSYTKKLADYPEKEKKIWTKSNLDNFEKSIALSGVNKNKIIDYLAFESYFLLNNQPIPTNIERVIHKFLEEKIIVKANGNYDITNLGAIFFARDLNNFESLSRKAIRVVRYKGKNRLETEKEFQGNKGYAIGFSSLIEFIQALLPTNQILKDALRKEIKVYPDIALREMIANALIHQDFSIRGMGPLIEIFTDRLEITNPGKPLIDILRFIDHAPQSRNEKLASFMRRLNICEERGTGVDKTVYACEFYQ